jgi:hypothetical protein
VWRLSGLRLIHAPFKRASIPADHPISSLSQSVRLSVRMKQIDNRWTDLHEIIYCRILRKFNVHLDKRQLQWPLYISFCMPLLRISQNIYRADKILELINENEAYILYSINFFRNICGLETLTLYIFLKFHKTLWIISILRLFLQITETIGSLQH